MSGSVWWARGGVAAGWLGAVGTAVGWGCGEPGHVVDRGEASDELKGGALSNCYPQVVEITSGTGRRCSGTVIGDGLVLTSAHCITRTADMGTPMTTVTGLGGTATITAAYVKPTYDRCPADEGTPTAKTSPSCAFPAASCRAASRPRTSVSPRSVRSTRRSLTARPTVASGRRARSRSSRSRPTARWRYQRPIQHHAHPTAELRY